MRVVEFEAGIREARLMLPPLADYTDYPYRRVMAGFNPPFVVTEMISADALIHGGVKTRRMLARVSGVRCEGVQLVGAYPGSMAEAANIVEELGFDYIDVNMGCTINKVARQGAGISLMGDEDRACSIVSAIISTVHIPVTCKMRLGESRGSINVTSLSKKLEGLGVAAITVHGRSGEKKWGLPVDYDGIRVVVEALNIPVVANGGVFTGEDAKRTMERTGAAGVMPGRGLIGNPWIVTEITTALTGVDYHPPTLAERKETCILHMRYLCEYYGDRRGAIKMRRILPEYFSGCVNLRSLRQDVHATSTPGEVAALMDRILDDGAHGSYDWRVTSAVDPSPTQG
jgi:nifR3 family TIM-barrel protein